MELEKLLHVKRLRITDELDLEIRRFMSLDDRESFDEAVRHLLRVGLNTRLGESRKGLVVERGDMGRQNGSYSGPERRRNSR
jgi:hypothetical protein